MAMNVGPAEGSDEDEVVSTINTTPLVDVMLVLLIIFLITIPVVTQSIAVQLPNERNIATQTKPENVVIAVDRNANIYWNTSPVNTTELLTRLKEEFDIVVHASTLGVILKEMNFVWKRTRHNLKKSEMR